MNIWEWFFGQAGDAFNSSGKTSLDLALQRLNQQPFPPIDSPMFQQLFATAWALGIILALISGFFSGFLYIGKSMTSIGSAVDLVARFTFFMRVVFFGFVAPPGTALVIYVTRAIMVSLAKLPGSQGSASDLSVIGVISEAITGGVLAVFNWAASFALRVEADILTAGLLFVLVLSPVFYGFSIVGVMGLKLWRLWVGFWLVTVTAAPIIALLLAIGNIFVKWMRSNGIWAGLAPFTAVTTIVFASLVPIVLVFVYQRSVAEKVQPALVSYGSRGGDDASDSGPRRPSGFRHFASHTASTALGNTIAKNVGDASPTPPNTTTPRVSGAMRMKAGTALGVASKTLAATHPVAAVAVGALGVSASRSGQKASNKALLTQMPAPTGQPIRLNGNSGNNNPPKPQLSVLTPPPSPLKHTGGTNPSPPVSSAFLPINKRDRYKS